MFIVVACGKAVSIDLCICASGGEGSLPLAHRPAAVLEGLWPLFGVLGGKLDYSNPCGQQYG